MVRSTLGIFTWSKAILAKTRYVELGHFMSRQSRHGPGFTDYVVLLHTNLLRVLLTTVSRTLRQPWQTRSITEFSTFTLSYHLIENDPPGR